MTQPSPIRILWAAAGGLLGAAFLPAAVAVADDYTITPDPGSQELVTDFYGIGTNGFQQTPPALSTSVDGTQLYDWTDPTTGQSGTFNADVSISTNMSGATTTEVMVAPGAETGTGAPPVGSVFDIATNNRNANYTFYQDLKGAGTGGKDVIDYYSHNAFGQQELYTKYDAASVTPTNEFSLGNGYTIDAAPTSDPASGYDITGINGLPPDDMVDQGSQLFYVEDGGHVVGSFEALKTTTSDLAGSYTQALLVTQDVSGTPGTALGDVPNVGSVYNTFTIGGIESIYQDLTPTTAGGKDVITYGFGSPSNTNGFDAAGAPALGAQQYIPFGTGDHIVPDSSFPEVFTGINGLPPYDVGIQGYQLYDVKDASGATIGTFYGDETTTENGYGHINEAIVVTQQVTGDANDPTVGSVFDTAPHGFGGELLYTDLVGQGTGGTDKITESVLSASGAILRNIHQTYDFSALFHGDAFQAYAEPAATSDVVSAVDPAALTSVDPAAGLDATPLLDMFPHLEAAVNFLTGLF